MSTGSIDFDRDVVTLRANGEANLAVLQGVLPELRGAGRAELAAQIGGTTGTPTLSGNALVTDGRLRSFAFPHALDAINGIVTFDATTVRLDGLRARLADGAVQFGGRLGLRGLALADYDVTLTGHDLRLRYPEGVRSLVDATLTVQGPVDAPVLGGSVLVRSAVWTPPDDGANLFGGSTAASPPSAARRWPARWQPRPLRRCASTCASSRPRPCGSRTTVPGSSPAPTSTCAAPSTSRWSSGAPTSSAAR